MFRPPHLPMAMTAPPRRAGWKGALYSNGKIINCVECLLPPFTLPEELHLEKAMKEFLLFDPTRLNRFILKPLGNSARFVHKWLEFNRFLLEQAKVAVIKLDEWELFIPPPPCSPTANLCIFVYYRSNVAPPAALNSSGNVFSYPSQAEGPQVKVESISRSGTHVHPSHLETLEQMHAAWIFGAVAELIDNSRDAKATRMDISIEEMILEGNESIPVLQVVDNGRGMNHDEIVKMLSFGHKRPEESDADQIGHFGVGFKTGAMRIGKDAVIFSQTKSSCSMGFLSKSYNSNLEDLEVPIVSFKRFGSGQMTLDVSVCTKENEEKCKIAVAKYSPFKNDLSIGAQFAKIESTGTRIFVYNLEQWDNKCIFEWKLSEAPEGEAQAEKKAQADIKIRSHRVRVRAGQTSKQVPLDFSLRAYAEVLFLVPSLKIFLQGTPVISRNLAKSFQNMKKYEYEFIHEEDAKKNKFIPLILGKRQVEYNRGNCGIFLYWHGRLIEAYKRVGAMVHSADIGRGIIGVMDVTDIMDFGNGKVGVLNNKQGFTDSDRFSKLEKWLEKTFCEYWDDNYDEFGLFQKEDLKLGEKLEKDAEWVQCQKCEKWRELPEGWCADDLMGAWFCYMKPFEGNCSIPEVKKEHVVTVGLNRDGNMKTASVMVANGSVENPVPYKSESSSSSLDIGVSRNLQRLKRVTQGPKTVNTESKRPKT